MKAVDFGVILAPGRFDATPAQAQAAWDGFRADPDVDLIIATEYGSGRFDRALRADGWDHFRGNGECVVSWRTDTFKHPWNGAGYADRVGTEFYRGGNHHAQTPIASMPLRHICSGVIVRTLVSHMPAHIQAGDGFRKTTVRVIQQGRAWVTSLAAIGNRTRRFGKHHPASVELVAGDWNTDFHRAHWRALVGRTLGLRCAHPLPKGGDLGGRLVSWAFVRGLRLVNAEHLDKPKGYDHQPIKIRFRIKEK